MLRTQQTGFQTLVSPPNGLLRYRPVVLSAAAIMLLLTMPLYAGDSSYDTIRFYTGAGKPEEIRTHALSPDGRFLALSFSDRPLRARSGITVVDLANMRLVGTFGHFSDLMLAFSSDSQSVMAVGNYSGILRLNIPSGQIRNLGDPSLVPGRIGIQLEERNGKLLVKSVLSEFNPTLGGTLQPGDEIVACNEGPKATRYDDSREWVSLLGKSADDAIDAITGSPGTWVQIRVMRSGMSKPVEAMVQRQWPPGTERQIPDRGECMTVVLYSRGERAFHSADTGRESAFLSMRDTGRSGWAALSPDGQRFAWISRVPNRKQFCVEVHSLEKGIIETSVLLNALSFRDMHFTADSSRILVGTRDTVEVLNLAESAWEKPISLTPSEDRDNGRIATRRIPVGLGLPGDLFTTYSKVVYSRPAALKLFDVSESGILAVGSETGDIVLVDLKSGEHLGVVGEKILGGPPELLRISRGDGHLIAYAKGVLHLFEFDRLQPVQSR